MTLNVGTADRIFRAILGVILIVAPLMNIPSIWSSALLFYGSIVVGLVLVGTAAFGLCPIYRVLGISTNKPSTR